jgi:FKBP-type peptidyl-prolyl cis-trans isomerase FkpA
MQKILIPFLFSATLCLFSCKKQSNGCGFTDDTLVAPTAEQDQVKEYIDSVGITATLHPSGFYYQVVEPGADINPGICSRVTVAYRGKLVNSQTFDSTANFNTSYESSLVFTLGSLIDGWRKGVPLIKKGGKIRLFIPPTLGYGASSVNTGIAVIPPNSILIFDISLLNVQ